MSTVYVFNDEMPAMTSAAEDDVLLIHDTSAGSKKDVTPAVLRAAILGTSSTSTLGFYGATSVARYAVSIAQPASTAAASVTATQWGFSTSTQADAMINTVRQMASAWAYYGLATST